MTNQDKFIRHTAAVLLAFGLLLPGLAAPCLAAAPVGPDILQLPELNWEKRSDWLDVTKDVTPAAVGDGVADDTAALQAAFDKLCGDKGAYSTVYIPPGTYRITRQISPVRIGDWRSPEPDSLHIRGHGRSTRIVWDGPAGGTMFRSEKFGESTYVGIVWDGRGRAARGFMSCGGNESHVKHEHQAFMNFTDSGSGVTEERPNPPGSGTWYLETPKWSNCLFVNCGKGLAIWHYNDYLYDIDGCSFYDCGYGIWCRNGNFYARNCHFERSRQADVANPGAIHGCSVRRCTSVGSRAFLMDSGNIITVQDCHVSGWTDPNGAVISSGSMPMLIFDCVFTNAPSANPPIRLDRAKSVVHSNNRTGTGSLFGGSLQHVVEVPKGQRTGSITSAQQSFFRSEAAIPTKVFDAKRDFGVNVQQCIDAARQHGQGAIAYFPRGNYTVSRTVNVAGGEYYVGGSGILSTNFHWRGASGGEPMFLVSDPQNVRMEYMALLGGGVLIRQVSTIQRPSRMHYEHMELRGGTAGNADTFTGNGAFEAVGLSRGSVLTAYCVFGLV
jgi:hypothetical protein